MISASPARTAQYWIEKLGLEPHPEGGYFRQTYRAELTIARAASTAIYFLLEGRNFSAFHRLRSDEVWHFYGGETMAVHVIDKGGKYSEILLGGNAEAGEVFQGVVKAGCWFGSEVAQNPHFSQRQGEVRYPSWALVGCTVAPGFDFEDFEMGKREELVRKCPEHRDAIERLTRE